MRAQPYAVGKFVHFAANAISILPFSTEDVVLDKNSRQDYLMFVYMFEAPCVSHSES